MKRVAIYTDGACRGNPGPGGWGVLLIWEGHREELSGYEAHTTNNRMELLAPIHGLESLTNPCIVDLYTDSMYVKKGITEWIHQWKKNNWRTASKQPVKNQDLWERLERALHQHQINFHWVKAHNGHAENSYVDALAVKASHSH